MKTTTETYYHPEIGDFIRTVKGKEFVIRELPEYWIGTCFDSWVHFGEYSCEQCDIVWNNEGAFWQCTDEKCDKKEEPIFHGNGHITWGDKPQSRDTE